MSWWWRSHRGLFNKHYLHDVSQEDIFGPELMHVVGLCRGYGETANQLKEGGRGLKGRSMLQCIMGPILLFTWTSPVIHEDVRCKTPNPTSRLPHNPNSSRIYT